MRGLVLSLKEKEFVEAAQASGASSARIIIRHILPNIVGPIMVNTTLAVGAAIITESTLSFLGLRACSRRRRRGATCSPTRRATSAPPQAYLIYFPAWRSLLTVLA